VCVSRHFPTARWKDSGGRRIEGPRSMDRKYSEYARVRWRGNGDRWSTIRTRGLDANSTVSDVLKGKPDVMVVGIFSGYRADVRWFRVIFRYFGGRTNEQGTNLHAAVVLGEPTEGPFWFFFENRSTNKTFFRISVPKFPLAFKKKQRYEISTHTRVHKRPLRKRTKRNRVALLSWLRRIARIFAPVINLPTSGVRLPFGA